VTTLDGSVVDDQFRARCRAFLVEHASKPAGDLAANRAFCAAASQAGLAGLAYAVEYGGAGLTAAHERIWREEKARFPAQDLDLIVSHGMCLPMINEFGTPSQKSRYMADNISARTIWCQMFSEPNAGSDVAALSTRAEFDGSHWVLNGQKVWTTLAHHSDYGLVVARSDPTLSKHAGLSMFIVDMTDPGIEVRPINQIDGKSHFNEVFLSDVRVPADGVLGELNDGWRLATAMLMYERVAIGTGGGGRVRQPTFKLLANHAKASGSISSPAVRDRLVRLYAMETCNSLLSMRTRAELRAGRTPGPGGSLGKLAKSQVAWFVRSFALELAGPASVADVEHDSTGLQYWVLHSFQDGIAGGTDEIQRNIIGERVLGLPR
jgi:alkylation response protein AidB-like acyl-CoA dehydrogenase